LDLHSDENQLATRPGQFVAIRGKRQRLRRDSFGPISSPAAAGTPWGHSSCHRAGGHLYRETNLLNRLTANIPAFEVIAGAIESTTIEQFFAEYRWPRSMATGMPPTGCPRPAAMKWAERIAAQSLALSADRDD